MIMIIIIIITIIIIIIIIVIIIIIIIIRTTPIVHWAYPPERRTLMAGHSYDAVPTHTAKKASILDQALLVSGDHHHHHHHGHAHRALGLPSGAANADGGPQLRCGPHPHRQEGLHPRPGPAGEW
jgi:hypothetical protein